jgi:hypothetical protein
MKKTYNKIWNKEQFVNDTERKGNIVDRFIFYFHGAIDANDTGFSRIKRNRKLASEFWDTDIEDIVDEAYADLMCEAFSHISNLKSEDSDLVHSSRVRIHDIVENKRNHLGCKLQSAFSAMRKEKEADELATMIKEKEVA